MMLNVNIAIISRTIRLGSDEAAAGAAAIQQQIQQDFGPVWSVTGSVVAFAEPQAGYVPIYIYDDINMPGIAGYHATQGGQAYAVVEYGTTWTVAASHECLEMIIDPTGNRTWPAVLPGTQPRQVSFLLEVCDPCQDIQYAYPIGNSGFYVSDFYTPSYFDPDVSPNCDYSFRKNITEPKEILLGGTLCWIDIDGHAYQAANVDNNVQIADRGLFTVGPQPMREFINAFDQQYSALSRGSPRKAIRGRMNKHRQAAIDANAAHSECLDRCLSELFRGKKFARPVRT